MRRYGEEAVELAGRREVGPALEKIVEANVLLSGLGFEGCGVAGAHGISQGFTLIPEMHGALHGEEVAVGLLAQLALEGRDDDFIFDLIDFYRRVGLPACLADLGLIEVTEEKLDKIANFTCRPNGRIFNMAVEVTPEKVKAALRRIQAMVDRH